MLDIFGLGKTILDKIFPDKNERQKYELKLLELQNEGYFKEEERRYQAIITEISSQDKFVSRARVSFLYIMYGIMLMSIPLAILHGFYPKVADSMQNEIIEFLTNIPDKFYKIYEEMILGYITIDATKTVTTAIFKKK